MNWDANWISALGTGVQAFAAIVALIVAVATMNIARKQNKNMKLQVNLELYEKRYEVYQAVSNFLANTLAYLDYSENNRLDLMRNTRQAIFLFDQEIIDYIGEIRDQSQLLESLDKKIDKPSKEDSEEKLNRLADQRQEVFDWFGLQLKNIKVKFSKYLDFRNINVQ